ncbi:MAG: subclass B3 metallo-beta-lactamase, partial [Amphiplicatus sp.]
DAPVLAVVGDKDEAAPAATNAAAIAAGVAASRYEVVPGAGHYTFLNPCTKKGLAFVEFCKDAKGVERYWTHEAVAQDIGDFFDATLHPASGWGESNPGWIEPYEPFRVIGNIYSVGPRGLGVYLIATDEGHILLDGGLPEGVSQIARNIKALGFKLSEVKVLLNSHEHFDHSGGLAALKALTGANLIALEGDRSALEGGFYLGAENDPHYGAPPVAVDAILGDGGTITLGGAALTANLTPGHTRGCTSWSMTAEEGGTSYDVLVFCSASVAGNRLADPLKGPQYEGIVEDYRRTFEKAKGMSPDELHAGHPEFFAREEKRARQKAGDPLAFVDPEAFPALIAAQEADFEKRLAEQEAAQEQ